MTTKTTDIDRIKITSWAAPTPEDADILEGLSDRQYRALLQREIQKGIDSGVSDKTMHDIWKEARRRMTRQASRPDAL